MTSNHFRPPSLIPVGWFLLASAGAFGSRPLEEGRLTQAVREVVLTQSDSAPASASLHALVRDGSVRTGIDSRAELTFRDQTVARLGDNTALAISSNNRTFELLAGAILAQTPAGVGATRIRAGYITASVTGTTLLLERNAGTYTKCIVLNGTVRLCLTKPGHSRDCVLLRAGQMLIASPAASTLPDVVDVDLVRLNQTCRLITEFPVLPRQDLLGKAASKQRGLKSHGVYADTNLVILGRGTLVNVTDPDAEGPKHREGGSPSIATDPKPNLSP